MRDKITSQIIKITPSIAKKYLKKNINNRPISKWHIESLKRKIIEDRWIINGDAIRFDGNQQLIDGQHRLHAVIAANKSINSIVINGLSEKAFTTIDEGKKRGVSDVLSIIGNKNSSVMASSLRLLLQFELKGKVTSDIYKISNDEVQESSSWFPELRDIVYVAVGYRNKYQSIGLPSSVCTFAYYLFDRIDHKDARFFFDSLYSGANLTMNHPILVLRTKLLIETSNKKERMKNYYWCHIIIKAWNAYRNNKTIKQLKITENEKFPKPI